MFGIAGTRAAPELLRFVRESDVGGVILFLRNYESPGQVFDLISALRDAAKNPLIVSVDQEGGRVARLTSPFTKIPPMAKIGLADPGGGLAREVGGLIGTELSAAGFNLNFAPVLDVATNPKNPVIGDRAFSSDADVVARLGCEFISGMESSGVAACGKHFPGHGDTIADSHHELPVLSHARGRFDSCEFVPFRAAARAGVSSMMIAHILATSLDPNVPSSISRATITGILRDEIGYDGVIFSDDLMMKGIADMHPPHESAWRAIMAGTDIAMVCSDDIRVHKRVLDGLKRAADDGRLSGERILESLARIDRFKKRFCEGGERPSPDVIGGARHAEIISKISVP